MSGPVYAFRDRRWDHLFPHDTDPSSLGILMEAKLRRAEEKAVNSLTAAMFFPLGRQPYAEKLDRLIESMEDAI